MSDLSHLPHRERAKRYRYFAHAARLSAASAKGELREAYIKIAGQWEQLALEADEEAKAENQH